MVGPGALVATSWVRLFNFRSSCLVQVFGQFIVLIPLAGMVGFVTEELSKCLGDYWRGFLLATMG